MSEEMQKQDVHRPRPKSVIGVKRVKRDTVAVSASAKAALWRMAQAQHTTITKVIESLLSGEQVQAAPAQIFTTAHTHDECAMEMLKLLPPEKFDLAKEICFDQLGIRPWQLVVGHLRKVADQGILQAPLLDSRWDRVTPQASQIEVTRCEECRQPFMPERLGQRFCGPVCGGKAARASRPAPHFRDTGTTGLAAGVVE